MIIGVDAGTLSVTDDRLKVGVYRVTKHALAALAAMDRENRYRIYTFTAIEEGIAQEFDGRAEIVQLVRRGWQRIWLPLELKKRAVDVFLGFAQALPSVKTLCDIGFIYDLGFLSHPEAYGSSAKILKLQTDELVRRADHIITISHATKADLTREYGLPAEKITVAYPGVDMAFSPAGEKYVGPKPYFLFVGSLNKVKDIPTLLESFVEFLERRKKEIRYRTLDSRFRGNDEKTSGSDDTYDLYLIGGDYWPDPAIDETIGTLHLEDRVKKFGFVPDSELPKYYRGATAFVTTALQEGFCLPAVEAMACGTPVVAMNRGALAEVVGEGGIIISEKRKARSEKFEFVKAMEKMADRKTREKFSKKAVVQARRFRWENFGKVILDRVNKAKD